MNKWLMLFVASFMLPGLAFGATATSVIEGTSEDSEIFGWASLEDTEDGLLVEVEVFGAPAGEHGFHIHQNGSCDDAGKAAGGHFNPAEAPHGNLVEDGAQKAHAGDLGNIEIGADGDGSLELVVPGLNVEGGDRAVGNRAFVLHAQADDFGQPTGNAGERIACGVIEIEEAEPLAFADQVEETATTEIIEVASDDGIETDLVSE